MPGDADPVYLPGLPRLLQARQRPPRRQDFLEGILIIYLMKLIEIDLFARRFLSERSISERAPDRSL